MKRYPPLPRGHCFALACLSMFASAAALAAPTSDQLCAAHSAKLLAALQKADFMAATKDFDAAMRKALSPNALRQAWQSIPTLAGALHDHGDADIVRRNGVTTVLTPLHYAKGQFDLSVSCNAAGAVNGLFIHPHASRDSADETAYASPDYVNTARFHEHDFNVGTGPSALPGTLSMPLGVGPFPALVLVHGSGPQDRDESIGPNKVFRDLAQGLASQGIAVLRYDKRTLADPRDFTGNYTVNDETVNDAVQAAAQLARVPGIDGQRVYLLGHSLGAMMAPRIGKRDPQLAGLILMAAPSTPLADIVVRQVRQNAQRDGRISASETAAIAKVEAQRDAIRSLRRGQPTKAPLMFNAPASYWLDLRHYDPVKVAASLPMPMLILQGGRDIQVSPSIDFARWQQTFAHTPRVKLIEYPTLSHLFMPAGNPPGPADYHTPSHVVEKVVDDIADWIKATHRP